MNIIVVVLVTIFCSNGLFTNICYPRVLFTTRGSNLIHLRVKMKSNPTDKSIWDDVFSVRSSLLHLLLFDTQSSSDQLIHLMNTQLCQVETTICKQKKISALISVSRILEPSCLNIEFEIPSPTWLSTDNLIVGVADLRKILEILGQKTVFQPWFQFHLLTIILEHFCQNIEFEIPTSTWLSTDNLIARVARLAGSRKDF